MAICAWGWCSALLLPAAFIAQATSPSHCEVRVTNYVGVHVGSPRMSTSLPAATCAHPKLRPSSRLGVFWKTMGSACSSVNSVPPFWVSPWDSVAHCLRTLDGLTVCVGYTDSCCSVSSRNFCCQEIRGLTSQTSGNLQHGWPMCWQTAVIS